MKKSLLGMFLIASIIGNAYIVKKFNEKKYFEEIIAKNGVDKAFGDKAKYFKLSREIFNKKNKIGCSTMGAVMSAFIKNGEHDYKKGNDLIRMMHRVSEDIQNETGQYKELNTREFFEKYYKENCTNLTGKETQFEEIVGSKNILGEMKDFINKAIIPNSIKTEEDEMPGVAPIE